MRAGTREAIILTATNEETHLDAVALEHSERGVPDVDTSHPLVANAPVRSDSPTFAELGVRAEIVRALAEAGIERAFAIQELTLPLALAGDDVIGQARTGTGKTLGFGVPLLQRVTVPGDGTPQALVVVPTRELCLQVTHDLTDAAKHLGVRVLAIYGGRPYEPQINALRKGVDLVVGTPGRLLDLAEQRHLVLGKVRGLVLDEADEMLDLGFLPDIERILRMVPDERQTMLFSATMPGPIITLARTFLNQPTHVRAEENDAGAIHERTEQFVYRAHALDKTELLARALQARERGLCMIFTRTKRTAQKVADEMVERGFAAAAVHGDLGQGAREQALRAFRSGKIDVLVATDVAARGIDVEGVTHVINYQCPEDEKTYVHRIGRTGRAGRTGVAVTLVDWDEMPRWKMISDALDLGKPEPVETYSTSDHLFAELDIPAGSTGRLPLGLRTRAGLDAEPEENLKGERKPRKRGRKRGAGGAPGTNGEAPATADGTENGGGRTRRRRRSRAGVADGEVAEATPAHGRTATGQVENGQVEDGGTANGEAGSAEPTRSRRRRRRGGSSGEAVTTANGSAPEVDPAQGDAGQDSPAQGAAAADAAPVAEAPAGEAPTRSRRRSRAGTSAQANAGSAPVDAPTAPEAPAADAPAEATAPKRTRTRKKAEPVDIPADVPAEAVAVPVTEVTETVPEAAPKRTRTRKKAEPAEAPAGTAPAAADQPAAEAPPKRTRTRKAAAPAEAGEAADQPAAEAPKRTRTRKAAEATADAQPEEAATRPRTRRKAESADAEDAERPRTRRRRTRTEAEGSPDALPSAD
ncbi:DEAD/DEAH box helicase [Actinosynnema sp. NPDC050436]|uniref:DEAD/DEAH box helicase n=1 Tax=Actinosynnema sp. NPDC050436 TaxID=3155659 RepID=UPI0033C8C9D2